MIRSGAEPSSPARQMPHLPPLLLWKKRDRPSAAKLGQPPSSTTRRRPVPSGAMTKRSAWPARPLPEAKAIRSPEGDQHGE